MTSGNASQRIHALASARSGHFALESGYHGALWLDLDALFAEPSRIAPLVAELASLLAPHRPDVICGPLLGGAFLAQLVAHALAVEFAFAERVPRTASSSPGELFTAQYRVPPALARQVAGKHVAIVDDVMSAGSSLRATHAALRAAGATTVAVGALLVLGDAGERHFGAEGIVVEALARDEYTLWAPSECPMCRNGTPLE